MAFSPNRLLRRSAYNCPAELNSCSLATLVGGSDRYLRAAGSIAGNGLQCQCAKMSVERGTRGSDRLSGRLITFSVYRRMTQGLSAAAESRLKDRSWPTAATERSSKHAVHLSSFGVEAETEDELRSVSNAGFIMIRNNSSNVKANFSYTAM